MSDITHALHWLAARIAALWSAAKPEIVSDFQAFMATFEADALAAVEAELPKAIAGAEKFSNALKNVGAAVEKAGWTASMTALMTLVQDAYTAVKGNAGETLATPPAS